MCLGGSFGIDDFGIQKKVVQKKVVNSVAKPLVDADYGSIAIVYSVIWD